MSDNSVAYQIVSVCEDKQGKYFAVCALDKVTPRSVVFLIHAQSGVLKNILLFRINQMAQHLNIKNIIGLDELSNHISHRYYLK